MLPSKADQRFHSSLKVCESSSEPKALMWRSNKGSEDREGSSKNKGVHSKVQSIEAFARPSISGGNTNYNYNQLKQSFNHLSIWPNKSFNSTEIGIILSQSAYELQRPLDYKIGTRSEPFAVLTELGWVTSGYMVGKRRESVCLFASKPIPPKLTSSISRRRNCRHKRR